jgi:hypothetical protein
MRLVGLTSAASFAIALLALAAPTRAQVAAGIGGTDEQYERLYGPPIDVALDALINGAAQYGGRAVRTTGRLDVTHGSQYLLRDDDGNAVRLVPAGMLASKFQAAAREWLGRRVEVTGFLGDTLGTHWPAGTDGLLTFTFYRYTAPPDDERRGRPAEGTGVSLESLVTAPGRRDGELVRVTGMFRGENLYGDLPRASRVRDGDWVIKEEVYAVWVTGRRPRGEGFALEASKGSDTGRWVEVVGRPETRNGITVLHALRVALAPAPPPPPVSAAPLLAPPKPMVAPKIVFTLPLDGETRVPVDARFTVQFSKDMEHDTFHGRVVLRYGGPAQPGDRAFVGLVLTYDAGRRALTVDPGVPLRPNRAVELLLRAGILDSDGLALQPRAGGATADTVDVLRYRTAP